MKWELAEPTKLMAAVGRVLREARRRRGWSMRDLCQRARIDRHTLARYERGWVYELATADRVAETCGIDLWSALVEDAAKPGRSR